MIRGLDADRAAGLVDRGSRRRRHGRLGRASSAASRSHAGRSYATDFHNDRILVYDSKWRRVVKPGAFVDRAKPAWYAPFGIQAVGDRIFVTYAYPAPVNGNDAPHGGYVDEFDLDGKLVARVGHTSGARRAVGRRARAVRVRPLRRRSPRRELRQRQDQRLPAQRSRLGVPRPTAGDGSTASGESRSARAGCSGPTDDALLRRRAARVDRRVGGRTCGGELGAMTPARSRTRARRARPAAPSSRGATSGSSISSIARVAASVPSSRRSWRIVVSGGCASAAASRSSKPTTATSRPGSSPASRIACSAASAIRSDAATIAVGRSRSASSAHVSR